MIENSGANGTVKPAAIVHPARREILRTEYNNSVRDLFAIKSAPADAWRAQQIVYLANTLEALEEADGSSVFDNTTVLWTSEIGAGASHDYKAPAWNITGGGHLKPGRYLRFSGDQGSRHNLLLTHYLRYFGLDISKRFGHPDYALGDPLPGLSA